MSNVIDFEAARKKRKAKSRDNQTAKITKSAPFEPARGKSARKNNRALAQDTPTAQDEAQVIDVTERIAVQQAQDRRQVQRVVFNEFISAHVYIPGKGLLKVILKNIHHNGLAFDVEEAQGSFPQGEEVEMRFYLNHQTFFRFICRVVHTHYVKDEGVYRHGCQFAANTVNEVALKHFIGFLENISASLKTDRGERTISKIYS